MTGIELATITTALTFLGCEAAKGAASEVGKNAWEGVKKLFGWAQEPPPHELPRRIAEKLEAEPQLLPKAHELARSAEHSVAAQMVGGINIGQVNAEKVVVAEKIDKLEMN